MNTKQSLKRDSFKYNFQCTVREFLSAWYKREQKRLDDIFVTTDPKDREYTKQLMGAIDLVLENLHLGFTNDHRS